MANNRPIVLLLTLAVGWILPEAAGAQGDTVDVARPDLLARFESVTLIPLAGASAGRLSARLDRFGGVVLLESTLPFAEEWLAALYERVETAGEIAGLERRSSKLVGLRLDSLAMGYGLLGPADAPAVLVVGRPRRIPSLRPHFFGHRCAPTLPPVEHSALEEMVASYCDSRFRHPSSEPPAGELTLEERELLSYLRHEVDLAPADFGVIAFERLLFRTESLWTRLFATTGLALRHALRDELPAALDRLSDSLEQVERLGRLEPEVDLRLRVAGEALFERLIRGALASDDAQRVVDYAERYGQWRSPDLNTELMLALAARYRDVDRPAGAIEHYRYLLTRAGTDEAALLAALAESYIEAGDAYRAHETTQFLAERYPSYPMPAALVPEEPVAPPVMGCEYPEPIDDPLVLLVQIGCAVRAGDRRAAADYAGRLQQISVGRPGFDVYGRLGTLWAASLDWDAAGAEP